MAHYIAELVPDADVLVRLEPEEVAAMLLRVVEGQIKFHPSNISKFPHGVNSRNSFPTYARLAGEVDVAISEGWNWLEVQGLIVPESGTNGSHGWKVLSRRGRKLTADSTALKAMQQAAAFPRSLLHPTIADKVWIFLARGELDEAVFAAFKAVEEQVRDAGGFADVDIGVDLMRKAFDKTNGPLTNKELPEPERAALAHLFAGAIGSYKNPHSHRTVRLKDHREAQEMVLLASHLLRIVDSKRNANGPH